MGALTPERPYIEILTVPPPAGWGTTGKVWEFRIGGKVTLTGKGALLRRELYLGDERITQLFTYRIGNDGDYYFDDVHLVPQYMDNMTATFSKATSTIDKVSGQENTPLSTTVGCGSVIQVNNSVVVTPGANFRYIISYDGGSPLQPVFLGYFTLHEL
jgi:hypothetical protein